MSFTVYGLFAMTLNWHDQGYQVPPDKMAALALEIITAPLLTLG